MPTIDGWPYEFGDGKYVRCDKCGENYKFYSHYVHVCLSQRLLAPFVIPDKLDQTAVGKFLRLYGGADNSDDALRYSFKDMEREREFVENKAMAWAFEMGQELERELDKARFNQRQQLLKARTKYLMDRWDGALRKLADS